MRIFAGKSSLYAYYCKLTSSKYISESGTKNSEAGQCGNDSQPNDLSLSERNFKPTVLSKSLVSETNMILK